MEDTFKSPIKIEESCEDNQQKESEQPNQIGQVPYAKREREKEQQFRQISQQNTSINKKSRTH